MRSGAMQSRSVRSGTPPDTGRTRWCFFSPGHRSLHALAGDSRTSGGAEAQVAHLAAAMAARGETVSLIYGDGCRVAPPLRVAGVLCLDAAPAWRRPASLPAFWRTVRRLSPNVLYARLPGDFLWMLGLIARLQPDARFVYALAHDLHTRGWTACEHRRWFHAPLFDLGLRSAHAVAVQHDGQAARLAPRYRSRIARIPNLAPPGVSGPDDGPRPLGATRFDAVWVAKIRPEKRLDRYLDLVRSRPDLAFALVGGFDPSFEPAERLRLESAIAVLPNLAPLGALRAPEVLATVRLSRVLVNTSAFEGFPNTMLEAWSVGVPVVSDGVDPGGVIVREGLGLVAGRSGGLGDALAALVGDPGLNDRMGRAGLAYVRESHSREGVCRRLAEVALGHPVPSPASSLVPSPAGSSGLPAARRNPA